MFNNEVVGTVKAVGYVPELFYSPFSSVFLSPTYSSLHTFPTAAEMPTTLELLDDKMGSGVLVHV